MNNILVFAGQILLLFRIQFVSHKSKTQNNYCLALMAARLPVTAWKPVLMVWTEHLE